VLLDVERFVRLRVVNDRQIIFRNRHRAAFLVSPRFPPRRSGTLHTVGCSVPRQVDIREQRENCGVGHASTQRSFVQ
jgi:hypothetical protein